MVISSILILNKHLFFFFLFVEEVILCVCGLHFEEGLMVQCGGEGEQSNNSTSTAQETTPKTNEEETLVESNDGNKNNKVTNNTISKDKETLNVNKPLKGCGVWQHARCMAVVDVGEPYYCHRCQPREVINYFLIIYFHNIFFYEILII